MAAALRRLLPALAVATSVAAAAVLTGCGPQAGRAAPTTIVSATPGPTAGTSTVPAVTAAGGVGSVPTAACSNAGVIAGWPLRRVAAQLVVAPVLSYSAAGIDGAIGAGMGGVLFLGSAPPPPGLTGELSAAAPPSGDPAPLVMADEEGGAVQRLEGLVPPLASARALGADDSPAQIEHLGRSVAGDMAAAGIDTDLAPVLDVDSGPGPSALDPDGTRSYSGDPGIAAADGVAMLEGLRAGGVLPVVKHFPGLGGATGNTDEGPASTPPIAALESRGLVPFRAAIAAGAPAVMVANASVPGLATGPASLSAPVIEGLLRAQLGFSGLVMTDSLSAGSITQAGYSVPAAATAAVEAGADMVLWGSTLTPADTAALSVPAVTSTDDAIVDALVAAVGSGRLGVRQLDSAAAAVVVAKGADLCRG